MRQQKYCIGGSQNNHGFEYEGGTSQQLSIFPVDSSTPYGELMSCFHFFPCVFAFF